MDKGRFFTAFIAGLAAGTILGILFAPYRGDITRKKLTDSSKKLANEGIDALAELKEKIMQHTHHGNGHNGHEKN
jgi:gas vesicle protein